ncbi:hypothetical protein ACIRP2_14840 [Streptomyces sp. NPDC101194]|uniref:hypothetical protein n=1 Tax=Streptomyces sp. NPDC101194 TaxID=3366127 RepID=UPI0038117945
MNGDGHTDLWVRITDGQLKRFLCAGAAALPADPPTIHTAPVASYPPAVAVSVRQRGRSEPKRRRAA